MCKTPSYLAVLVLVLVFPLSAMARSIHVGDEQVTYDKYPSLVTAAISRRALASTAAPYAVIKRAMMFNYRTHPAQEIGAGIRLVAGADYADPPGIQNYAYASQDVAFAHFGGVTYAPSLQWLRKNHPDWIEYKCDRSTPAWQFKHMNEIPVDFANPAVQQWAFTNWVVPAIHQGYDGVEFDNVWLYNLFGRCGHYDLDGHWVQQYTGKFTDLQFQADVIAWARRMRTLIHGYSPTFKFGINYSWYPSGSSAARQHTLLSLVDTDIDESGQTREGTGYPPAALWLDIYLADKQVLDQGGVLVFNGQVPDRADAAWRVWVMANYLLLVNARAYISIEGVQQYGELLDYPEYHLDVGEPIDSARELADGLWIRHFTKVTVSVNPQRSTASIAAVH